MTVYDTLSTLGAKCVARDCKRWSFASGSLFGIDTRLRFRAAEALPMIVGYHLIWTVYGSWLPNDPRGSSSHIIRSPAIAELGELHPGRKRIQPAGRAIREFYDAARPALKHDFRTLSESEIGVVGASFDEVIRDRSYSCYACAIMPDHVHLLVRRHRDLPDAMIEAMQESSRVAVLAHGDRPASHPGPAHQNLDVRL